MKQKPVAIALAASKGGVSKTTLAANLAVRAAQDSGRVAMIDMEPQQSLARFMELRRQFSDQPLNPRIWRGMTDEVMIPSVEVNRLKSKGAEWIFIDLPPGDFDIIRPGVAACDFVLIPTKPSPFDLEALGPVVEVCEAENVPYRFILTMYEPGWNISKTAFAYLERLRPGKTLPAVMCSRQAYVGAAISGHTGPEYNKDARQAKAAREEIDEIWAAVRKLALASVKEVA